MLTNDYHIFAINDFTWNWVYCIDVGTGGCYNGPTLTPPHDSLLFVSECNLMTCMRNQPCQRH